MTSRPHTSPPPPVRTVLSPIGPTVESWERAHEPLAWSSNFINKSGRSCSRRERSWEREQVPVSRPGRILHWTLGVFGAQRQSSSSLSSVTHHRMPAGNLDRTSPSAVAAVPASMSSRPEKPRGLMENRKVRLFSGRLEYTLAGIFIEIRVGLYHKS